MLTYEELTARLEAQPMAPSQWAVVALCFALNMLDGMDVLVMSYAAPLVMDEWRVDAGQFGLVFSAALVGMALGAALIAPRADTLGRRRMVLLSTLLITSGMIMTAQSGGLWSMLAWRGFTGLGIGAMLATLTAVASENASSRHRNLVIGLVLAGYPIGATLTGFVVAPLLDELGWRWLFMAAGLVSALTVPVIFVLMPESLAFILRRQPPGALRVVNRTLVLRKLPELENLPAIGHRPVLRNSLRTLLDGARLRTTLFLWCAFFMSFLSMYFLLSWVPKLVVNAGLGLDNAIYAGAVFNLGAFFGIIGLGHFSYQYGLRRLIFVFFLATALLMLFFGSLEAGVSVLLVQTFALGLFMQGGFVGLYAVAARVYSTDIRATGIGWAIGAGRSGAIVGPWVGGIAIGLGWGIEVLFMAFALPCVVAAAATLLIRMPPDTADFE